MNEEEIEGMMRKSETQRTKALAELQELRERKASAARMAEWFIKWQEPLGSIYLGQCIEAIYGS